MHLIKQPTLPELLFTMIWMLCGEEGKHFSYYEFDEKWWEHRLMARVN